MSRRNSVPPRPRRPAARKTVRKRATAAPGAPTRRPRAAAATTTEPTRRGTRELLLETAGQVFSEKGFAGSTGKEICERSGANAAAVVYHFGGMENLYRAVLSEARSRLAPAEQLAAVVARETDPKAKLTAFIGLLARVLTAPASSTWATRLLSREFVSPSAIFDEWRTKEMRARAGILRSIISELTGLPADHPAVMLSCINIIAPFGILLLVTPQRFERTFPVLSFGPEALEENINHMVEFALGGLASISRTQA